MRYQSSKKDWRVALVTAVVVIFTASACANGSNSSVIETATPIASSATAAPSSTPTQSAVTSAPTPTPTPTESKPATQTSEAISKSGTHTVTLRGSSVSDATIMWVEDERAQQIDVKGDWKITLHNVYDPTIYRLTVRSNLDKPSKDQKVSCEIVVDDRQIAQSTVSGPGSACYCSSAKYEQGK